MQLTYCPKCAGIDLGTDSDTGMKKCKRCGYFGKMNEGAMDEINSHKLKLNRSIGSSETFVNEPVEMPPSSETTQNQLKERLKSLKGKKTDNFEFL